MTLFDLLFLASVLFVLVSLFAIVVSALRRRAATLRRWARLLAIYLAVYAAVLLLSALLTPRRIYAPGERRCWDDWCTTALRVSPGHNMASLPCRETPDIRIWLAEIQVSSVSKRIRQRAPDARAELEDQQGTRYSPCGAPLAPEADSRPQGAGLWHELSDPLGPGESFTVMLPFELPANRQPAGIVMHHGDFPGVIIIGSDSSLFHRPALQPFGASQ
jgi:hypothetical protein